MNIKNNKVLTTLGFGLLFLVNIMACDAATLTATGLKPVVILFHPSGKFAYAVNNQSKNISQYRYESGELTPLANPVVGTGYDVTFGSSFDPTGKYLMVPAHGENKIYIYSFDPASGELTLIERKSTVFGTLQAQFSLDGKFVYILSIDSNQIYQYAFDSSNGRMTPLSPLSIKTGMNPTGVGLSNDGKYMYEISSNQNNTTRYTVDTENGQLTMNETYSVGNFPVYSNFDPSGAISLCVNYKSNSISVFTADIASGKMDYANPRSINAGAFPNSLPVYDKSGQYVYVANEQSNDISQYKLDLQNKTLIPLSPSRVKIKGIGADWLTISPDFKYVFVLNAATNNIERFTIGTDGRLFDDFGQSAILPWGDSTNEATNGSNNPALLQRLKVFSSKWLHN
ncbi:MAG TPA: beta-propeller fold lactonase family protein [Burkholderiales bacterium]|nr:beta-propeller fold lactonase family protein [Burkholderiales bacterium]